MGRRPRHVRLIIDNQIKPAYASCTAQTISPPAEQERLRTAFDTFVQLAQPYRKQMARLVALGSFSGGWNVWKVLWHSTVAQACILLSGGVVQ